jgi:DNA topoisomerase-1
MVVKHGRYGEFLACSGYPECKHTQSININKTARSTGIKCPEKGCEGELVERTSKRGKVFYGCNRFPECKLATWDKPVAKPCPACNAPFLVEKSTKKQGKFIYCLTDGCDFKEPVEE